MTSAYPIAPETPSQALQTWDAIAPEWDNKIGREGNKYWTLLQRPFLDRALALLPASGFRALDLATGNGIVARLLAERGASEIIATDGAQRMVDLARERTKGEANADKILFRTVDVTDEGALMGYASGDDGDGFDVVTCNMALMDISDIEPLAKCLPKLLKKGGIFVAQQLHPVFVTSRVQRILEVTDEHEDGVPRVTRAKLIRAYMSVQPWKGVAFENQSARQWYFHRPLHELFGTFFKHGLAMDLMEELAFDDDAANLERIESSCNYTQFPMILGFRMKRVN